VRAIGLDVGGTFTDLALWEDARGALAVFKLPWSCRLPPSAGRDSETQLGPIEHRLGYRFGAAARRSANSPIVRLRTAWHRLGTN